MCPSLLCYARRLFEYWFRGGERPQLQLNPYEEFFLEGAVGGFAAWCVYSLLHQWMEQFGTDVREGFRYACISACVSSVLVHSFLKRMENKERASRASEECKQTEQDGNTEVKQLCSKCQPETRELSSVEPVEEKPAQRECSEENLPEEAVPEQGLKVQTSDAVVRNEESGLSMSSHASEPVVGKSCDPKTEPEGSDLKPRAEPICVASQDSDHPRTVDPETKGDMSGSLATVSDVPSDQAPKVDFTASAELTVNVPPADGSEAGTEVPEEPKTAETKPDLLKEVSTSEKAESSPTEKTEEFKQ